MTQGIKEVAPAEAYKKIKTGAVLLDVREIQELEEEAYDVEDLLHIPLSEFVNRISEIPRDKEVIVGCHSGIRSFQVTTYLTEQGYNNVINLMYGIDNWVDCGFPVKVRKTTK
ncbi:sulfurtransferase [Prolixibacter sp. SD074]|jgi:rhodanese-related sulfurtransferase|nr:sulfurtransferase [Prolixibacter sp. SD074]